MTQWFPGAAPQLPTTPSAVGQMCWPIPNVTITFGLQLFNFKFRTHSWPASSACGTDEMHPSQRHLRVFTSSRVSLRRGGEKRFGVSTPRRNVAAFACERWFHPRRVWEREGREQERETRVSKMKHPELRQTSSYSCRRTRVMTKLFCVSGCDWRKSRFCLLVLTGLSWIIIYYWLLLILIITIIIIIFICWT